MNPLEKLVSQAALDVAIERLTTFHPHAQLFVFGPKGDPFWSQFTPSAEELELLTRALSVLEANESRPAPLTVRGASGQFSAMVLDAERTLFAVVVLVPMKRLPDETRVSRRAPPGMLTSWRG